MVPFPSTPDRSLSSSPPRGSESTLLPPDRSTPLCSLPLETDPRWRVRSLPLLLLSPFVDQSLTGFSPSAPFCLLVCVDFGAGGPPLHNRTAMPAECGPAYVFLASAEANFIQGQVCLFLRFTFILLSACWLTITLLDALGHSR
jgi:hypothetical protein